MTEAAATTETTTAATTTAAATTATPWYEGKVDAEIIGHWDNKGWKKEDPAAIALEATKAARELQKHFGVPADQLLKLPKPEDSDGWKAVHQRLGMPAEAKDYDLSSIKFADGTELDPTFANIMRAALHNARVSKDAAPEIVKAVVKSMDDNDAAELAEFTARLQTERAALQKDWGVNFEFERLTAMKGAKLMNFTEDDIAAFEHRKGYKWTMELCNKIGKYMSEDTFVTAQQGGQVSTANGAKARLDELQSDPAWGARVTRGEKAAVNEMNNLLALIHGTAA